MNAIYSITNIGDNFPSKEEISDVERDNPMQWDPCERFMRSSNQSMESFEEQKNILQLNTKKNDKYASKTGVDSMTYTKNMITFGSPGTGKSYVGELTVLYALSLGLNTITTSLMGVRAMLFEENIFTSFNR